METRGHRTLGWSILLCLAIALAESPTMAQKPVLGQQGSPCELAGFSKEIEEGPGVGWTEHIVLRGPAGAPAEAVDLVISVDTSNPYAEGPEALAEALGDLIGEVRAAARESGREHRIAVVSHNRVAALLYGLGSDYEAAVRSLKRLPKNPPGGNCIECALDRAREVLGADQPGRSQHIILVQRGLPDLKDPADPEDACPSCAETRTICVQRALERAQELKAAGVQIHPVIYGLAALDLRCGPVTRQLVTDVFGEIASDPEAIPLSQRPALGTALNDTWRRIWSDAALNDLVLTEIISPEYEIMGITPAPSGQQGHTLWWALDRLEPGDVWQVAVELRIDPDAVGELPFAQRTWLDYTDCLGQRRTRELDHQPAIPVEPLTVTCPADRVVPPEQGCAGAPVEWEEPRVSGGTPPYVLVSSHASGALFPPGRTRVTCTVTDARERARSCGFDVLVLPPSVDLAPLPDIQADADGFCGVRARWELQVIGGTPPVTVVCDPPLGTVFGAGTSSLVTCTVTDACGNADSESFRMLVSGAQSIEQGLYSGRGDDLILRLVEGAFHGYAGEAASEHDLILIPTPPAPDGWNLPDHEPSEGWRRAKRVWWDEWTERWSAGAGGRLPKPGTAIGLRDATDKPKGKDWDTHLIRRTFRVDPPASHMHLASARLAGWSDNKSAWWWQGAQLPLTGQGFVGEIELADGHVSPRGGTYVLAIQTSNDCVGGPNPHGTAFELHLVWECSALPDEIEQAGPLADPAGRSLRP